MNPDSLRERGVEEYIATGDGSLIDAADAWQEDRYFRLKAEEDLLEAKRILISEGWDAHKLDAALASPEVKP